jgi:hypothetical protein
MLVNGASFTPVAVPSGWFRYGFVASTPGNLTITLTVEGQQAGPATVVFVGLNSSAANITMPANATNATEPYINVTVPAPTKQSELLWNPLMNPVVHFVVKLPNVSAAAYGPTVLTDLIAAVAAKGRLESPEWAEALLLGTSPLKANISVSTTAGSTCSMSMVCASYVLFYCKSSWQVCLAHLLSLS